MFNDIGPLELVALAIIGVLVFGPDKLPKVIQDASRFIRKIREFSESAKEDIRTELGPEFKDFEFEDLNPKTFVRKQLMDGNDDLGLKEIRESFDLRKEVAEVTDAVNGRETAPAVEAKTGVSGAAAVTAANGSAGAPDLLKKREQPTKTDHPPFDADAT
ncbi:sec-independent translocase [Streptomyces poriferorum]|uniref:Sec-independent protein translocase protein TatB n=1 Tax=Streptomyces poriferorum TaxID=2798799 RepID=A0ABY9INX0_9ACTN|nr:MULTISPECIES: sec-independent translocase [Streptomyces]WSQ43907.1 sec-independent translocase [Streptomyces sp. NBC_01220]MBW5253075.1 Sec-independent protein translocase subunit TatB [Streptomyces poriferorum]MBW5260354.1 Sec-independent protein translocase subunit TatB [Streptomyces poriferorum]MDP5314550.1 sec-independent translocase [Streptomyces sp. Alt4]WLQ50795.1 sec-independent translocase [Streptomyces sp. Alt1]